MLLPDSKYMLIQPFPHAVGISQKQRQQKWKLTSNQRATKGYRCRDFSNAQFVKDPNENAIAAHRDVFPSYVVDIFVSGVDTIQ